MSDTPSVKITSNAPEYRDAITDFMVTFRLGRKEALRTEGRFLGERLISFTPPRTAGQGRNRVAKDIKKIFLGLDDMREFGAVSDGMRNNIIESVGGEAAVRIFAKKDGTVYGVDRKLYRPDATIEEMAKFHQSKRDRRGRVGEAGQRTRDIGRWKFLDVMVVPAGVLNEYIRSVKSRVGRAKGGWADGTMKLGGKVAQWIAVHARTAGYFRDALDGPEGALIWDNRSEWTNRGDEDRIVENSIKSRTQAIAKRIKYELKKSAKPAFKTT